MLDVRGLRCRLEWTFADVYTVAVLRGIWLGAELGSQSRRAEDLGATFEPLSRHLRRRQDLNVAPRATARHGSPVREV